jgi:FecR protein
MKASFASYLIPRTISGSLLLLLSLALAPLTVATQLKEARVTEVVKEVKLLRTQGAPRPATVSDEVRGGTAVRTGSDSRAELTFTDQTLARLGANTVFGFNAGTRSVDLGGGAMLLYVPKNIGGAKVNTAAITAAITGTTCLIESHRKFYSKLIFLEGSGRAYLTRYPGQSVVLHAGDMLIVKPNATRLPNPQKINLRLLRETSPLLLPPLPSEALMLAEEEKQSGEISQHTLVDPTSHDVIDQKTNVRSKKIPGGP